MAGPRARRTLLLAVLLVTATLPPATVGVGALPESGGETFHVVQGDECYEVAAFGDGSTTVSEFYDYRTPPNGAYASYGTTQLQANQVSNLFVYHGTEGYSLVVLHDSVGGEHGSTVTFAFSGLPADREWVVEDDAYAGRDDDYDHGETSSTIDWMWSGERTDGAAVRGLAGDDYAAITIDPGFNEAAAAWGDWQYSGGDHRIHEWRLLGVESADSPVSLTMDQSVALARGPCQTDGTTTTTTPSTTTTTSVTTTTETTSATTETTTTATTATTETTTEITTTETTTTTTTTTATTSTTTTETTTTTSEDDSDESAVRDENSRSSRSGGGQGVGGGQSSTELGDPEPTRTTATLADDAGKLGTVTLDSDLLGADPEVGANRTLPAEANAPAPTPERDGFRALSYLVAETDRATMTVELSTARLDARNLSVSDVALFRVEKGSWTAVESERLGDSDGEYRLRTNATGGTYAVGVERPAIGVTDLSVDSARAESGEQVAVVATVRNVGRANGTQEVVLSVDGEHVATRNVSVPADETREVAFDARLEEVGTRDIRVGNASASVVVEAATTEATTRETTARTPAESPTTMESPATTGTGGPPRAPVPGFGTGLALVGVVAALVVAVRRSRG